MVQWNHVIRTRLIRIPAYYVCVRCVPNISLYFLCNEIPFNTNEFNAYTRLLSIPSKVPTVLFKQYFNAYSSHTCQFDPEQTGRLAPMLTLGNKTRYKTELKHGNAGPR